MKKTEKFGNNTDEMENFRKLERMGEGTYGVVYKAIDKRTGEKCALKVCSAEPDQLPNLFTEALVLHQADHPNIVHCDEIFLEKDKLVMKMELCSMDLRTRMSKYRGFGEKNTAAALINILNGLLYLHRKGITHCDLKPDNILYKEDKKTGILKVGDFNSAQFNAPKGAEPIHETPGATRWYRAPEALLEEKYTPAADVWAVGCVMYELLTGDILFAGESEIDQTCMIINRLGVPPDYKPCVRFVVRTKVQLRRKAKGFVKEGIGGDALDLLLRLLAVDPAQRISVTDALNHPYLTE